MRRHAITPGRLLTISVICFVLALICFGFILAGCASSTTGKALNVGVGVSAGLDWHSSQGKREANPLVGDGALRQAVMKAGGASAVIGLAALAEVKGKPVVAHVIRAMAIAGWSAIAARNYQIARAW